MKSFQTFSSLNSGEQPTAKPSHPASRAEFSRSTPTIVAAALALAVAAVAGCDSSAAKRSSPAAAEAPPPTVNEARRSVNLDDYPVEPISIEEFFKQKAATRYLGKRVTWRCIIEAVSPFNENPLGFSATGFPVEFAGLKEPSEDKVHILEYSKRYNDYAQGEIARVSETVTFFFNDRPSYEKLRDAKGKRATISGIVSPSPLNNSADLKDCRVMSLE